MSPPRNGISNIASKRKFRKDLRNSLTPAEASLWKCLSRSQLDGKKFRRQHSVGRYIVDFCCPECRLVIELDGQHHFSPTIEEYEAGRTVFLERLGWRVIRFENQEIFDNLDGVLETIRHLLRPSSPRSSCGRHEGERAR